MPSVKSTTNTSVGLGSSGPVDPQPRKAMPRTDMPDRRSPNDQKNYGDDLVAGIKGPKAAHNPGQKPY